MKEMKKFLALALVLALMLCLCACGKKQDFNTRLQTAQENMNELDSFHMDMTMNVTVEMSLLGQSTPMDITVTYDMDVDNASGTTRMEMTSSALGFDQNMLCYTEKVGEETVLYMSKDGGRSWQRENTGEVQINAEPEKIMELFNQNAESFERTGTETINGSQATVFSGVLSEEYMEEVMNMTGLSESLGTLLNAADGEELFQGLGEIPITIAIDDDSDMIVRYTMDVTQMMERMLEKLFSSIMSSYGLGSLNIQFTVSKAESVVYYSQFNSAGPVVIPDAAKAA